MPKITREYKLVVEHPRIIRNIDTGLKTWYTRQSNEFPMFTSDQKKEEIQEQRDTNHREAITELKRSVMSVYPEFANNKHKLTDSGRMGQVYYFTLERELDIIAE